MQKHNAIVLLYSCDCFITWATLVTDGSWVWILVRDTSWIIFHNYFIVKLYPSLVEKTEKRSCMFHLGKTNTFRISERSKVFKRLSLSLLLSFCPIRLLSFRKPHKGSRDLSCHSLKFSSISALLISTLFACTKYIMYLKCLAFSSLFFIKY